MPRAGKVFLAAVSGGADSTAMLAALAALRNEAGFGLHCIHVEHGIRPADESRGDAGAVEALCAKLDVPCRVISVAPGKIASYAGSGGPGIEAAARVFRMRALYRERRRIGADWILTAHTRDDVLETLLMRILRGSGPAGLALMPRTRGRIQRPLLDFTRQDVLAYLDEKNLPYRTDSTNADIRFLRNRVRHKLIPLLDSYFPSWRSSLLALGETQSLTSAFLAAEAHNRLPWECLAGECIPGEEVLLRQREKEFFDAPPIMREEAIFAGVDKLAALKAVKKGRDELRSRTPRRTVVRRAAEGSTSSFNFGPVQFTRKNGFVTLESGARHQWERGFSLLIKEAGLYTLKGRTIGMAPGGCLHIRVRDSPGSGKAAAVDGFSPAMFYARAPLVFRGLREGDQIVKTGHKRGFSDIIDRENRSRYAIIIVAEDTEGPVAFIGIEKTGCLLAISGDAAGTGVPGAFGVSLETGLSGTKVFGGMDV